MIRDGATLVRNATDVIDPIGAEQPAPQPIPETPERPTHTERPARTLRDTATLHSEILSRLGPSPVAEDQLIRDLDLNSQQVTPTLLNLELDGKIKRAAGGLLSLVH